MKSTINKGDKVKVKTGKRFKNHEVLLYDPSEGWIVFKSCEKDGNDFTLNTTIHKHHIKLPEVKVVKTPPKKRGRKKKKK
jgi:hypothetical protein